MHLQLDIAARSSGVHSRCGAESSHTVRAAVGRLCHGWPPRIPCVRAPDAAVLPCSPRRFYSVRGNDELVHWAESDEVVEGATHPGVKVNRVVVGHCSPFRPSPPPGLSWS